MLTYINIFITEHKSTVNMTDWLKELPKKKKNQTKTDCLVNTSAPVNVCIGACMSSQFYGSQRCLFVLFQIQVEAVRREFIWLVQENKTLWLLTMVREFKAAQLCRSEEWFLHELTVCFLAWCIKLLEIFSFSALKQPKWMFRVLCGFQAFSGMLPSFQTFPHNKQAELCQSNCYVYRA